MVFPTVREDTNNGGNQYTDMINDINVIDIDDELRETTFLVTTVLYYLTVIRKENFRIPLIK